MLPRRTVILILSTVLLLFGTILVLIGIVIIAKLPEEVERQIKSSVLLRKGSTSFDSFLNPKYDMIWEIRFFNLSNAERFLAGIDKKPVVNEVGPYRYSQKQKKRVLLHENGTLEYLTHSVYTYLPDGRSESDLVTILNIPLLASYAMIRSNRVGDDVMRTIMTTLSSAAENSKAFVTRSVGELLFTGYNDPLLDFGSKTSEEPMPDRMGFFYGKNNSFGDDFLIDPTGTILSWNYKTSLNYWHSPTANMINGSDGGLYHPFIDRAETLRFFAADMCRSLHATYESDSEVDDVQTYRFVVPPSVFSVDDWGFCQHTNEKYFTTMPKVVYEGDVGSCLPAGLLNISTCRNGGPIVLSWPHFSFASPEVKESVVGLSPDDDSFESTLDIEPMTGVVLRANIQLQINVAVAPLRGVSIFRIPIPSLTSFTRPTIVPTLWIRQSATADEATTTMMYQQMVRTPTAVRGGMAALVALGCVLVVVGVALLVTARKECKVQQNVRMTTLRNDNVHCM